MAGGRASTLLIRIVGDSTDATLALNQVATASAAAAEVVDESSDKMTRATNKTTAALQAEHAVEMKMLKTAQITAQQKEAAAKEQLRISRMTLTTQKQQLRGMQMMGTATNQAIAAKQREVYITQQQVIMEQRHTASLTANTQAMRANVAALERLQKEEMQAAVTVGGDVVNANSKTKKSWMGVAGAIAAAATVSIKAAVDLESANAAVAAIWGEQADEMMAFAASMEQYGLSTAQAAQASAILGAQLLNAGISAEQAQVMVEELIMTGVALANTFGTTVPQALTALGATFRGEFDSIEKYGVSINAAMVEAQMLEDATNGVIYATQREAQVMAIYTLILEQTKAASETLTDETITTREAFNTLTASLRNLAAEIGGPLLDVLTPLMDALGSILGTVGELIDETGLWNTAMDGLAKVLNDVWAIVEPILIPALEALDDLFQRLADFLDAYVIPVLDAVAGFFQGIADAIGNVITQIQELIRWVDELWTRPMEETAAAMNSMSASTSAFRAPRLVGGPTIGARGSGGDTYITVQSGVGDPHAIAKEIRRILQRDALRMGRAA